VPTGYRADRPATLILGLHGATQDSDFTLRILQDAAERGGHLLLAPQSRAVTWDIIRDQAGEDERLLDSALEWCFDRCNVHPDRVVIAGFSDGATAALSLGLINGDLFKRIVAFSPGFIVGDERHGMPSIFISHGTRDEILPIGSTSYRLVPALKQQGYAVTFREFDGPHRVPPDVVAAMLEWLG
jgi:predicted esterase